MYCFDCNYQLLYCLLEGCDFFMGWNSKQVLKIDVEDFS